MRRREASFITEFMTSLMTRAKSNQNKLKTRLGVVLKYVKERKQKRFESV